MPRRVLSLDGPSVSWTSIVLGFLVGSSLWVPFIVSSPTLTVCSSPLMRSMAALTVFLGSCLPSSAPLTIVHVPVIFFKSSLAASSLSAAISRPTIITSSACLFMADLQGESHKENGSESGGHSLRQAGAYRTNSG